MNFKNINTNELKQLLENDSDIVLLDIRTKEEYEEDNIEKSINIPLQNLLYDMYDIEEYKDRKVIVYCRSGHRSITACNLLYISGFKDLYNLEKGIINYRL
ncbi:MAG: rhodanese-like domain-containing protein [Clostridia bacterium]